MKVFVGSIIYRAVSSPTHECLRLFDEEAMARGVELAWYAVEGDADVGRARGIAATQFLATDCDVLLTIDDDIVFSPTDAISLCEKAMELDIVCGLYTTRAWRLRQQAPAFKDGAVVIFGPGNPPVEILYGACGFMAVGRRVMEKLAESVPLAMQKSEFPFRPLYLQIMVPDDYEGYLYLSEDYAFCHRARAAGFRVWLDPSIRLGHVGTYVYRIDDLDIEAKPPVVMKMERHPDGMRWYKAQPVPEQPRLWTPSRDAKRRLASVTQGR